jgi:hypothetical protein
MRKLCTDEVGGVKMEKNVFCNLKKRIFFTVLYLAALLALYFKDDLVSLRRFSYITF